jgi:hypothetical protein
MDVACSLTSVSPATPTPAFREKTRKNARVAAGRRGRTGGLAGAGGESHRPRGRRSPCGSGVQLGVELHGSARTRQHLDAARERVAPE